MPATNRIVFAESCQVTAKIRDTSLSVSVCTDKPPWSTPIDTLRHMQPDQVLTFKVGAICRLYLWSSDQAAGLFPIDLRAPKLHGEAVDCGEAEVKSVRVRCLDALCAPDENGLEHRFDFTLEIAGRVNLDVLVAEPANDAFMGAVLAERRRIWALLTGKSFVAATLDYVSNERMSVQQLSLPLSDIVMRMPGAPPAAPSAEAQAEPAPEPEPTPAESAEPPHDADGVVIEGAVLQLTNEGGDVVLDRIAFRLSHLADQRRSAPFWAVAQWAELGPGDDEACDGLLERLRTDRRFIVDAREGAGVVIGLRDPVSESEVCVAGADAPAPEPVRPMLTDDQVQELIRYIGLRGDNVSVDELASRLSFWPLLPKSKKKRAFAIEVMQSLSTQYLEFDRVLDPHAPPRVWLSDDARRDWTGRLVRVVSETFARSSVDVYANRLAEVVVEAGLLDSKSWAKVIVVDELERMGFIRRVSELGTPGFGPFKRCAMSDSEAADVLADVLGRRRRGHSPEPAEPQNHDESALVAEWLEEVRSVLETEGRAQWLDTLLTCDPYSPMEPISPEQALAALQATDWAALSDEGDAGAPAWLVAFKG